MIAVDLILSMLLCLISTILAFSSFQVFAQAQPQIDLPPPGALGSSTSWGIVASSIITSVSAVGYAWINASTSMQKRRAEEAEERTAAVEKDARERIVAVQNDFKEKITEIVQRLENVTAELKATEAELKTACKERDEWMVRAYKSGYRSSDDLPAPKSTL